MIDLMNIGRSFPSQTQDKLISILLYGSVLLAIRRIVIFYFALCNLLKTHRDMTIPFSKPFLLCQILLIQYPNIIYQSLCFKYENYCLGA